MQELTTGRSQLPDPFAVIHLFPPHSPYSPPLLSKTTPVVRSTLNPYWAAHFDFEAEEGTRCVSHAVGRRRC